MLADVVMYKKAEHVVCQQGLKDAYMCTKAHGQSVYFFAQVSSIVVPSKPSGFNNPRFFDSDGYPIWYLDNIWCNERLHYSHAMRCIKDFSDHLHSEGVCMHVSNLNRFPLLKDLPLLSASPRGFILQE
jgi:hypothetical protein